MNDLLKSRLQRNGTICVYQGKRVTDRARVEEYNNSIMGEDIARRNSKKKFLFGRNDFIWSWMKMEVIMDID